MACKTYCVYKHVLPNNKIYSSKASPAMKKKANFARNAAKWKH